MEVVATIATIFQKAIEIQNFYMFPEMVATLATNNIGGFHGL